MRILLRIFLLCSVSLCSYAQDPESSGPGPMDSLDFTIITTTDFMVGSGNYGTVFWAKGGPGNGSTKCPKNVNDDEPGTGILGTIATTLQSIGKAIKNAFNWLFGGCAGSEDESGGGEEEGNEEPPWETPIPGGYDDEWGLNIPIPEEGGGCYNCTPAPHGELPLGWGNGDTPDNGPGILAGTLLGEPEQPTLKYDSSLYVRPTDTLKPVRVTCPPTLMSSLRGDTLNKIWDDVKNSWQMQDLYAGLHRRKFEVGFRVSMNNLGQYNSAGYDTTGTQRNIQITSIAWTFMFVHSHPYKDSANNLNVSGPSPLDMYNLIKTWKDSDNGRFKYLVNISGDSDTSTFAVAITDSLKAVSFLNNNPIGSTVEVGGTNNWLGDKYDPSTLLGKYHNAYNMFKKAGYPEKDWENYANVYMAQELNMGITIYKKVGDEFKALNFEEATNHRGKKVYRITICD